MAVAALVDAEVEGRAEMDVEAVAPAGSGETPLEETFEGEEEKRERERVSPVLRKDPRTEQSQRLGVYRSSARAKSSK